MHSFKKENHIGIQPKLHTYILIDDFIVLTGINKSYRGMSSVFLEIDTNGPAGVPICQGRFI
ncbi:uncharacterized protein Dvar_68870 [Desulfosarcina variabilis str. Montpellier]